MKRRKAKSIERLHSSFLAIASKGIQKSDKKFKDGNWLLDISEYRLVEMMGERK